MKRRNGFTLMETLVSIGLLTFLTTTIAGILSFAMLHYSRDKERSHVERAVSTAMDAITCEFRQSAHSPLVTSALLVPAVDGTTTHEIEFTEPAPGTFNPSLPSIDVTPLSAYQRVHYYVTTPGMTASGASAAGTLMRELSSLSGSGLPIMTSTSTVASLPRGTMQIVATRIFANSVTIRVRAVEGNSACTLTCLEVSSLAQ